MTPAIATLTAAAEAAENNAPIREQEGRAEEAAHCRQTAAEHRLAIRQLSVVHHMTEIYQLLNR